MKKIELLVPAKNMECLKVAVENGADCIYLGVKEFNARTLNSDNNFTFEGLKEAIQYCKKKNVKTNLTLNTLIKDDEFERALKVADIAYESGISAIIVQDIGLGKTLIEKYPDLDIHASTQNTITNLEGVKMLENIGYKRAILSRELSINEIEEISNGANIEIETFIHGGLCISYSGQCLFSSAEYGLAGNRGMCVGSCRNEYLLREDNQLIRKGKILKPRDMYGLEYIPRLIKCGVVCLKVQGRTRGIDYIREVTRIYRKYIDLALSNKEYIIDEKDYNKLKEMSSRGFTDAHFSKESNDNFIVNTCKIKENVTKNDEIKNKNRINSNGILKNNISLSFEKFNNNYDYSLLSDKIKRIYIPLDKFITNKEIVKKIENRFELFIEMPLIILQKDIKMYDEKIKQILELYKIKGFVLSNVSDFFLIEKYKEKYEFIGNYTLNIFNVNACNVIKNMGVDVITPSIELSNMERIKLIEKCNIKCEEIVYGDIPLINMKYCIKDNKTICNKENNKCYSIIDINNLKEYECEIGENPILSKIYGSKKISIEKHAKESSARIFIHNENIKEINDIIENIYTGKCFFGSNYKNDIIVK